MTVSRIYQQQLFRITVVMCLALLIGFKVTAPLFHLTSSLIKEVKMTTETETDSDKNEKDGNTDSYQKIKGYNGTHIYNGPDLLAYIQLMHLSEHNINYQSTHYYKITTPPPDFC